MRESLIIPMMMFGRFRSTRAKRDENGNAIVKKLDSRGRKVYEKEKCWITHNQKDGDKGVYPSVNHIYERMQKGRQKLTKPAQDLKKRWEAAAHLWASKTGWTQTSNEKVVVELTAYFPSDNIRRDTNNVFKLMMDAFSEIIYDDDVNVLPRVMDFQKVKENEQPYFKLDIYLKSEEDQVIMERIAEAS
ncbi:RusA family crossover junction endodeoxyribonuclease [Bacillus halotolerans]|uniref:RusA family crossover junction endodeoxyribonuclease n=1 Tax=Bacillus halotolerans TaxID=260554 RepID=A0A9Q4ER60_9BACI|nr:RusA family crossover junction endodeoxyribonuclease [Bacillus halotolerans]MCY9186643.1 RusA family crossover junction endodeoxyribonuclease [Bacillus halotolerans]